MQNPWLVSAQNKRMLEDIDAIAMEVWGDDGTFGDFLAALTDDQTDLLFSLKIKDFAADPQDGTMGFELINS